jgi:hypothetical protein
MLKGLNFVAIVSLMGWGLGYFGQPHILARFMAADSHHTIVHARRSSAFCLFWRSTSVSSSSICSFVRELARLTKNHSTRPATSNTTDTTRDAMLSTPAGSAADQGVPASGQGKQITVKTDVLELTINTRGGDVEQAIYDIVLQSLETSLTLFRPGTTIQEVTGEVVRIMVTGLVELGILKGEVEQLIADNAHRAFFMHGLSHWLGLDVHDVGFYGPDRSRVLEPGMVITVEPGLYIAPDADVPAQYRAGAL